MSRREVKFEEFRGVMATWTDLFTRAAAFATSVGDRLIGISHSEDQQDGVIAVWYWADCAGSSTGHGRLQDATPVPGVKIVQALHHQPYDQWEFEVRDPDGHVLVFAERG